MDYFVAKGRGHRERSAINESSGSGGLECTRMTNRAAYGVEERVATCRGGRDWVLTAGRASCSHEVCKGQHVAAVVFRICDWVEWSASAVYNALSSAAGILEMSRVRVIRAPATVAGEFVRYTHLIQ